VIQAVRPVSDKLPGLSEYQYPHDIQAMVVILIVDCTEIKMIDQLEITL